MKIYRVYYMEKDNEGIDRPREEEFYTLEKLVEFLNANHAYYKHINEPITDETIIQNVQSSYYTDVILPANNGPSLWDLFGWKKQDELLFIIEINIRK